MTRPLLPGNDSRRHQVCTGWNLNAGTEAIAAMPAAWRHCLAGEGAVDLRGCRVLSEEFYLWSTGSRAARLASFFASKMLRGRVEPFAARFPRAPASRRLSRPGIPPGRPGTGRTLPAGNPGGASPSRVFSISTGTRHRCSRMQARHDWYYHNALSSPSVCC